MCSETEDDSSTAVITIYGKELQEVQSFKYLGRRLAAEGDEEEEIKHKIQTARGVMATLSRPLYKRVGCATKTKLAVFLAVTRTQLMFGCETWCLVEAEWAKLQSLEMQGLRRILGWRGRMTDQGIRYPANAEVWKEIQKIRQIDPIRQAVEKRQLAWWGRILRMGPNALAKTALLSRMPGPSYVGWQRPRTLVPRLRKLVDRAGLVEEAVWERDKWTAGAENLSQLQAPAKPSTSAAMPHPGAP